MTKEQKLLQEMLTHKNIAKTPSAFERIADLLEWNEEIERTEEIESGHSLRVAYLSKKLAERLQLDIEAQIEIYFAALFHDIGKHCISKEIIGKRGRLTDEEFDIIKTHCQKSEEILNGILNENIIAIIKEHHERIDGSGYPNGLQDLSIGAKILGIVDSYDAMTSQRVYNKTLSEKEALAELESCTIEKEIGGKGELYAENLVNLFKTILLEEI